jgi:hypothetical protein
MQTFGFTCGRSGVATLDQLFSTTISGVTYPVVSTYIIIPTTGAEGGIVYENSAGEVMYWPYTVFGYNPIAATKILTSATVNGTPRTTTATPIGWMASVNS